jgi:hypothetical protein
VADRKLRDIAEMPAPSVAELAYLQRKISAAGEMKTAIKRFVNKHPEIETSALRDAMEAYLNVHD